METPHSHSRQRAFALAELLIIIAILAILAGLLLPALAKAKSKAQHINCINNLKSDGLAFRMWGSDNGDMYPMRFRTNNFDGPSFAIQQKMYVYFQVMSNELSNPKILVCPSDDRTPAPDFIDFSNDNVSYFVGLDADETMPQMLLTGDRNLAINNSPVHSGVISIKSTDKIAWTQEIHQGQGFI